MTAHSMCRENPPPTQNTVPPSFRRAIPARRRQTNAAAGARSSITRVRSYTNVGIGLSSSPRPSLGHASAALLDPELEQARDAGDGQAAERRHDVTHDAASGDIADEPAGNRQRRADRGDDV